MPICDAGVGEVDTDGCHDHVHIRVGHEGYARLSVGSASAVVSRGATLCTPRLSPSQSDDPHIGVVGVAGHVVIPRARKRMGIESLVVPLLGHGRSDGPSSMATTEYVNCRARTPGPSRMSAVPVSPESSSPFRFQSIHTCTYSASITPSSITRPVIVRVPPSLTGEMASGSTVGDVVHQDGLGRRLYAAVVVGDRGRDL